MARRLYVPWGEDAVTAGALHTVALQAAGHVGRTAPEVEEVLYRVLGWLYNTQTRRRGAPRGRA